MYTLIETAKLNRIDPQAWLTDALTRIADHPAKRLDELMPWNWGTATDLKDIVRDRETAIRPAAGD